MPRPKSILLQNSGLKKTILDVHPDLKDIFEEYLAGTANDNLEVLTFLAQNGFILFEEEYMIAGMIRFRGADGAMHPVFPEKDDDELVLIKKVKKVLPPDREALKYLIDRVAGKPIDSPPIAQQMAKLDVQLDLSSGAIALDEAGNQMLILPEKITTHDNTIQTPANVCETVGRDIS